MRRIAWLAAVPLLGGCFLFATGESSQVEDVPADLRKPRLVVPPVMDVHLLGDPAGLKVGQWARYREKDRTVTIAVVEKEGENLWIEVVDEGEPHQVSARLVTPDGGVEKAFYCEVGKNGRSTVEPQELEQYAPPPAPSLTEADRETGERRVTVGGRELRARRIRVRYEDLEGRLTVVESLWHPDVPPVYDGSEHGGLVFRKTREAEVELLDFGADARPLCPRGEAHFRSTEGAGKKP